MFCHKRIQTAVTVPHKRYRFLPLVAPMPRKTASTPPKRNFLPHHTSPVQVSQAVPAIVFQEKEVDPIIPPPVYHFDAALRQLVRQMNFRLQSECVSIRQEKPLEWTVMGSVYREFVVFTLDQSYTFFTVLSLLPFEFEIKWCFSKGDIKADIENALTAVYI